ncbi:SRPBCC family protein [Sphingomonas sp.]|uniref:SRPBCC family protein n=1 Tax=Sphingomonas sp. TaxID=28214 RepID=UPI001EBBF86A|nr:SRPBCC family protein [Sphingomonas sp.]MBX3594073.1 SRPBCC family protein [Sphingomonas sp.]
MDSHDRRKTATIRIIAAMLFGLAFALGVYLLIEAANPNGLISFTFLMILPATVTAFVTYIGDPLGRRPRRFYVSAVPLTLFAAVVVASLVFLREGTICILMLSPFWLALSMLGGYLTWRARKREEQVDANIFSASSLLLFPLVAMQVEPMIPLPRDGGRVTRTVVINADPATVWRHARGERHIAPGDGRWNVSQNLIGLPRPIGARLDGQGRGAIRHVTWRDGIRFKEVITDWQPARRIWWDFRFDAIDMNAWAMQDRHLLPDSPHYRITDGGYVIQPLADGRTRLTLTTNYWVQTPVNWYARLWGELLVGDVSSNVLAVVRQHAERAAAARGSRPAFGA